MSTIRYLSQDIDYIDTLRTVLKGLQGFATMALELIQNADDAGAEWIEFDFRSDMLIVRNSSVFSECQNIATDRCNWLEDPNRTYSCDFHRMRKILSGDKRNQPNTTGSFGIGFISVLAYTDCPEVISHGHHWIIRPAAEPSKRIEDRPAKQPYTTIRIPWALDDTSPLRKELQIPPLTSSDLIRLPAKLMEVLPYVLLFLRNLKRLNVLQNGQLTSSATRELLDNNKIALHFEQNSTLWKLYEATFADGASTLRAKWNTDTQLIESKRQPLVQIAVPTDSTTPIDGLLYAFLPTETTTGFPFHINADFYLNPERRRVRFDSSNYEMDWNTAALDCAAQILANSLEDIGLSVNHITLYRILEAIKKNEYHPHFGTFWRRVRDGIHKRKLILTTTRSWVTPQNAYLLDELEYENALSVLHTLAIPVVHNELRQFSGLLRSLGVQELDVNHLYDAIESFQISEGISVSEAPEFLSQPSMRFVLYDEITLLHRRKRHQLKDAAKKSELTARLAALPVGLDVHGKIRRLQTMKRSDKQTYTLFNIAEPYIIFADLQGRLPDQCEVINAITQLDVDIVLHVLREIAAHHTKRFYTWLRRPGFIQALHLWFAKHVTQFDEDKSLRQRYIELPIFPAGQRFKPLNQLSLPLPEFQDPLKLDITVDIQKMDERVLTFWRSLGIPPLDLLTYIKRHLVPLLNTGQTLAEEQVDSLVKYLAKNLSQFREDEDTIRALSRCPFLLCEDGKYHPPHRTYFPDDQVKAVLGSHVQYLRNPKSGLTKNVEDFYRALGVTETPRPSHIVTRVTNLCSGPVSVESRNHIEKVFFYLSNKWDSLPDWYKKDLDPLRSLNWLPEEGNLKDWCKPADLYTHAQAHLFQSQGRFLDFKSEPTSEFRQFLGLKTTPSTQQVVNHLLWSADNRLDVHPDVYRFLQRQLSGKDHDQVLRLKDEPCINVPTGKYFPPSMFFSTEHPFGRWRLRLDVGLHEYYLLFNTLGVRDRPDLDDFVDVILDIAKEFGASNKPLDDDALVVLSRCYAELSRAVANGLDQGRLESLKKQKCVPNNSQRLLYLPERLFFDDKVGYANRFGGQLANFLIPKERDTWKALEVIGVRPLSRSIRRELVRCEDAQYNPALTLLLRERIPCINRIIERQRASEPEGWSIDALEGVKVYTALKLEERLVHTVLSIHSETLPGRTFFDSQNRRLYITPLHESRHLVDIAREVAAILNPQVDTCNIVSVIKDVLSAKSVQAAESYLMEIGYDDIKEPMNDGHTLRDIVIDKIGDAHSQVIGETVTKHGIETGDDQDDSPITSDADVSIGTHDRSDTSVQPGRPRREHLRRTYSRLRSYVLTEVEAHRRLEFDGKEQTTDEMEQVERAGMDLAIRHEKSRQEVFEIRDVSKRGQTGTVTVFKRGTDENWTETTVMEPKESSGYDLLVRERSSSSGSGEDGCRYIEVKAISSKWSEMDIGLTRNEFWAARNLGDRYYLYVVDCALEPVSRSLYIIQNPAGKSAEFRFDEGWKDAGETHDET